ncbi:efflux RND transporter permease subunit [Rhodopirellula sp. MGV]|uniref:efflux RND transporter permease subunit n=1 Tax=Rhodopirellula sp. MGV TaxID=2023130 RepID=UPI000B9782E2|nr:efflux RND transporter permease subunit [Rhodopirellula sp. MGV]OYP37067.1 acriflavin resistance protein [Rhodopirellula sp. MGV]PNY36170.1 AcrB/AcrD/AcrF family protein [Rhodopirellula baltica]
MFESLIRNPVKVYVGAILAALFGTLSLGLIPKQLVPEVENPVLTIQTSWPGASPQEIEREIIIEQEEQLQGVEGLVKMSSNCSVSRAELTLEFELGTNIDDALARVNTRLQQVREYPLDAGEPVIEASNVSDRPIARFALTPRPPTAQQIAAFQSEHPDLAEMLEPSRLASNSALRVFRLNQCMEQNLEQFPSLQSLQPPPIDLEQLRKFSEDFVEPRLERVAGVSNAETNGGREEELQVIVDPAKLAASQITIGQIRDALNRQNSDTTAGDIFQGKRTWVIRTLGQFRDPKQVERQLLVSEGNTRVYVGDVAEVKLGYKDRDSISRRYGTESIGVSVSRVTGANVLQVMQGLRRAERELNEGFLKRENLELFQYYDETEYIESAIELVIRNMLIGSAVTIIVLMLFLHFGHETLLAGTAIGATALASVYVSPWFYVATVLLILFAGYRYARGALVAAIAIPISICGAFLCMTMLGRSLNVISLAGMAFAVGMLVDNAVVVLENVIRRRQLGESAFRASSRGVGEVAGAIVASTLTTIAVFLPVIFVEATAGQLFRDIALAISCGIAFSMLVSFTVIPTAASRLFSQRKGQSEPVVPAPRKPWWIERMILGASSGLVSSVVNFNSWILKARFRSVAVVVVMTGVSILLSYLLWPKVEYLPTGNRNFVFARFSVPPGYNLDELSDIGAIVEDRLRPYWDIDEGQGPSNGSDAPVVDYYFCGIRERSLFMGFRARNESRAAELIPLILDAGKGLPGIRVMASQSSLFGRGMTGGRTIDIEISGPELERMAEIAGRVLDDVDRLMPGAQASAQPSLELASPEIHLRPKLLATSEMGIDTTNLGYVVDALVDGAYAGDYFVGGDKIDMTIKSNTDAAKDPQSLMSLPLATQEGEIVPLLAVADMKYGSGPEQIQRRERLRAITIQVSPPDDMPLEAAMDMVNNQIVNPLVDEGVIGNEYFVALSGTADKLRQAWDALQFNFLLALLITYLLMAALFESWLYPFVVIFSVPLGAVGGIVGLWLLNFFVNQSLDVLTMLGFIILIGTVVNNAILIVHQSLVHMREEHLAPIDAVPLSVKTRIRPICITTLTTVLGLLPLVLFPGAGSELYRGLGVVFLGGMVISTLFTLILVPVVFVLMMDLRRALKWSPEWELGPALAKDPAMVDESAATPSLQSAS